MLQIVSRLGIPGIDFALGIVPVAIVFTLFGTIMINGFNLIDGLNGLASYVTILLQPSVIAFQINSLEVLRFYLY